MNSKKDPDGREAFRSPGAIVVWWVWLLFAAGNLVDLAVQGRDRLSLVAAFILLLVTGIVYVAAKRPRLVIDNDGLTVTNPFRDHRVGWAAVAGADPTDLLRIRCEWPDGDGTRRRAIYSWAVHSSRRRQFAADMRGRSQALRGGRSGPGIFSPGDGGLLTFSSLGFGGTFSGAAAPENDRLRLDPGDVIAALTERTEKTRLDAPEAQATAPVSTWNWRAVVAVVVPGLALLIVFLA